MTTSLYGHLGWQFFVYGTYAIVAILLFIYGFMAFKTRKNALQSLSEEGFIQSHSKDSDRET